MLFSPSKITREIRRIIQGKRKLIQSLNLLRYKLSKKAEILEYKPIYLTILPIYRCNLACKMCLTHSDELGEHPFRHRPFKDMDINMFKDIISRFRQAVAVGFMGNGEPLLLKDIFAMIDHASIQGKMYTSMITNGVLLDKFTDDILASRLDEICISINGHNRAEFSRMTGMKEECFDKILEASGKLIRERDSRKSKLKINASMIVDSTNILYLQDMVNFSAGLGFDTVSFYTILPLTEERAKRISLYDSKEIMETICNIRIPMTKTSITLPVPLDGRSKNNICNDFFTCINIDGEGNVGGCNRQRFNIHDCGKYSDPDVWNNEYFRKERKKFLDPNLPLDEPCRVCFANSAYMLKTMESSLKDE